MVDFSLLHECSVRQDNASLDSVVSHDAIAYPSASDARAHGLQPSLAAVQLPPIETDTFSSGRHEVNPAIALNVIRDIQAAVTHLQAQQRQVIVAMRGLHAQGPMVDGWIQSSAPSQPVRSNNSVTQSLNDATILRHGDADALLKYVEALEESERTSSMPECERGSERGSRDDDKPSSDSQSQYWLCRLNDDGSIQSQPCPSEQMAVVGTAIARFQNFKQLKLQQQMLEAKLQQAVDMLTDVRTAICE